MTPTFDVLEFFVLALSFAGNADAAEFVAAVVTVARETLLTQLEFARAAKVESKI